LVAEGHTSKEIANLIFVGVKTVETHRSNLMDKLGVRGMAGLTRFAISRGIIAVDPL
jgi:DNA-binding NarL/FixJ family response regulator